jgi:hypothetical protein
MNAFVKSLCHWGSGGSGGGFEFCDIKILDFFFEI